MKNALKLIALIFAVSPFYAFGGGDPEFVKFPKDYEKTFKQYATMNRANQKQVAKLYANLTAVASYVKSEHSIPDTPAPGAIVVMEIYSTKMDEEGKPITGSDGLFEIDELAAIGVMENKAEWDKDFAQENRAGNWGFALYNRDGTPKSNDLECAQCHLPLKDQDYLFTYQKLVDFANKLPLK